VACGIRGEDKFHHKYKKKIIKYSQNTLTCHI
jgi:hypothetical protein